MAGIEHTSHDWIFSIDSDERCTPEAQEEILSTIENENSKDIYFIPGGTSSWGRRYDFAVGTQIIDNPSYLEEGR